MATMLGHLGSPNGVVVYLSAAMAKSKRTVVPKKKCCRDRPRCKRCPVVCKRLVRQGLAERLEDGRYRLSIDLSKKQLKAARA